MKKLFSILLMFALSITFVAMAQMPQPLPVDPQVRYGKLQNGLTYYIRHNELPKDRAEFYIAQQVGSVLEEENQRGLAHFLEHMAFNGTTNLPGKTMLNYLESIGVKFGADINAYTSFDQTVYNLSNVPVTRQGIIDTCLLVLHDWACGIALEDKEIDNERGVIREEWRTRSSAQARMWDKMVPEMYPNSQYANRMPIGILEVIDNFSYQTIRDYYNKWYRPDLQGIVIVGDFDVNAMEEKVKEMFGKIDLQKDPAERIYYPVPDNEEPIIVIATDKEATHTSVTTYYKHDPIPDELKSTPIYLVNIYMNMVASEMLNARLEELTQKANPPYIAAGAYEGNYFVSKTKDAFTAIANAEEGGVEKALQAITTETERVNKYGFTASEYERAKADFLQRIENQYNERSKQKNKDYVNEYVNHFIDGGSISGIETEYALFNQIAPAITIDQVNEYIKGLIGENNIVITVNGIEKEGVKYPSKEEILALFTSARAAEISPYQETVSNEPLISKMPKPGKVKKETTNSKFGTTEWILSNGAKVIIKPTEFKDDEIIFRAISAGGSSLIDSKEVVNVQVMNSVIELGGLGNFSATDLRKVLAGKNASVDIRVGGVSEVVNGNSTVKDLETLLQLNYLAFTNIRKDNEAFESWRGRSRAMVESRQANPMMSLNDTIVKALFDNKEPREKNLLPEDFDKIDYDRVLSLATQRFANAGDFTFTFVGNVNLETLKPLVEKYIASLPATRKREKLGTTPEYRNGAYVNNFERNMETPKSTVFTLYSGKVPYTFENVIKSNILNDAMYIIYTQTIREEEGGTYGVGSQARINPSNELMTFQFSFDTDPQLKERLSDRAKKEFEKVISEGIPAETYAKVTEYLIKQQTNNLKENSYWLNKISDFELFGVDTLNGYEEMVNNQNSKKVQELAKQLLDQNNLIEISMTGLSK